MSYHGRERDLYDLSLCWCGPKLSSPFPLWVTERGWEGGSGIDGLWDQLGSGYDFSVSLKCFFGGRIQLRFTSYSKCSWQDGVALYSLIVILNKWTLNHLVRSQVILENLFLKTVALLLPLMPWVCGPVTHALKPWELLFCDYIKLPFSQLCYP